MVDYYTQKDYTKKLDRKRAYYHMNKERLNAKRREHLEEIKKDKTKYEKYLQRQRDYEKRRKERINSDPLLLERERERRKAYQKKYQEQFYRKLEKEDPEALERLKKEGKTLTYSGLYYRFYIKQDAGKYQKFKDEAIKRYQFKRDMEKLEALIYSVL